MVTLFLFQNFEQFFAVYESMKNLKNPSYKNENIEKKYLNSTRRNRFLKVKNSLLELENDWRELKDGGLKNRELKIK